jgi:hypothetical protein
LLQHFIPPLFLAQLIQGSESGRPIFHFCGWQLLQGVEPGIDKIRPAWFSGRAFGEQAERLQHFPSFQQLAALVEATGQGLGPCG